MQLLYDITYKAYKLLYNRSLRNSVSSNNENQLRTDGSSSGKLIKITINSLNSVSDKIEK